jgi:hypothetical protein
MIAAGSARRRSALQTLGNVPMQLPGPDRAQLLELVA